ncbi:hypothetical protein DFH09DRAFT_899199, partial [Mycena vulgaris]
LRTVVLPHATLPRFLGIMSGTSARNSETCGLLLGNRLTGSNDGGGKSRFVVETLLIPKQHATSHTCTIDEEEGVLGFTEEHRLITLKRVNPQAPNPINTHASFQRMLPESFAVVCAPKWDPKCVILHPTDPPGLQTIFKCAAKQFINALTYNPALCLPS